MEQCIWLHNKHIYPIPCSTQSNLAHMHSQFLLIVEALAEFWAVMDELDEHTWVLEPEKPIRADTMRRIAIGKLLPPLLSVV